MQLRFTPQNVVYLLSSISLGTTVSNTQEKLETMVMQTFVQKTAVGRYTCTLGDKLQQHVAAIDHSMCTGRATRQQGEATRRSDKSLRVYWRIFVKIFVSETEFCRCNKSQKIKSD